MVLQQTDDCEPKSYWQPELTNGATEIGPLPKTLSLPYLDDLKLVADNEKVAVKQVTKLQQHLRFYKFISTFLTWFFGIGALTLFFAYSIVDGSFITNFSLFKFYGPFVFLLFLIRQSCIWLDKKYVKKPNFSAVVFNRKAQTITIKYGWKRKKLTAPFKGASRKSPYLLA